MSLPPASRIEDLRNYAPATVESDGESWSGAVRDVIASEPEAMRALGITRRHLDAIRFDEESGLIIIPVGRRDDAAVRAIMRALDNTTDLGEGSGEHELRGFRFAY